MDPGYILNFQQADQLQNYLVLFMNIFLSLP